MSRIIGEITVKFDGEDRTFKLRRLRYSHQARLFSMARNVGTGENADVEKMAAFQVELCSLYIVDDEGKQAFTKEEVDDWGGDNIRAVASALDEFNKPKTTVDHSGNS